MSETLAHLFGDYVVQSDYMALEKTSSHLPAVLHAASYTACFLPLTRDPRRLALISVSHFVIDRWRLARHVCWAKNQLAPKRYRYPWIDGADTGYQSTRPDWLTVWLMIICDNSMHLLINHAALNWRRNDK